MIPVDEASEPNTEWFGHVIGRMMPQHVGHLVLDVHMLKFFEMAEVRCDCNEVFLISFNAFKRAANELKQEAN